MFPRSTPYFFTILLLYPVLTLAQYSQVLDAETLQPIGDVFIYNQDSSQTTQSNQDGIFPLKVFRSADTLYFQHPSYQFQAIPMNKLEGRQKLVQLQEKIIRISDIVISAHRWEEESRKIPNRIERIEPSAIIFRNPQTSADLLDQSGAVFVQKSQLGGGSPMIRGFAANSLLIMIDGVRMNNAIFRSGNLQNVMLIDPNAIQSAEVLFGPGSVIYGSDALGGVMDFHTLQPEYSVNSQFMISGNGMARYSSANQEKTGHLDINLRWKKFSVLTSISASDFNNLRSGGYRTQGYENFGKRAFFVERTGSRDSVVVNPDPNIQVGSGYSQLNLLQKFRYAIGHDQDLYYSFHYTTSSNIPRYDRLIETDEETGLPSYASWFYGPQRWQMHQLSYHNKSGNHFFGEAKMHLYYQKVEESRISRRFDNPWQRSQSEKLDIAGLNSDFNYSINEKLQLFYGTSFLYNRINSSASQVNITTNTRTPYNTRYPEDGSDYYTLAGYLSTKYSFTRDHFSAGLRFNHVGLEAKGETINPIFNQVFNLSNQALNGSAGWVHEFNPLNRFSLMFSTGFRAPNLDDVGKIFEFTDSYLVIPNPDLEPEYSYNLESSYQFQLGSNFEFRASAYYTILNNAMVRRNALYEGNDRIEVDNQVYTIQALTNASKAYIVGGNLNFKSSINPFLKLEGSFTLTEGRDLSEDLPLRHIPPYFGQLSITFQENKLKMSSLLKFNGAKPLHTLPPSELAKPHLYTSNGTPAWYTINFYASYNFNSRLKLTAALENLMDFHYRPYSSGISAAGRNFIIGVRSSF